MIVILSNSEKCELSKRRMMRRTGLPASSFAPFVKTNETEIRSAEPSKLNVQPGAQERFTTEAPQSYVEVDAISLQREPVPVPVEFPDAAEPDGFRIEIKDSLTGQWLPASGCKARARDHEKLAEQLASAPSTKAVRIIKRGGTRAFKCWNV